MVIDACGFAPSATRPWQRAALERQAAYVIDGALKRRFGQRLSERRHPAIEPANGTGFERPQVARAAPVPTMTSRQKHCEA